MIHYVFDALHTTTAWLIKGKGPLQSLTARQFSSRYEITVKHETRGLTGSRTDKLTHCRPSQ